MKRKAVRLLAAMALLGSYCSNAAAEQVTLTYGDWQAAQKAWNASLTEALAEFESRNPDIKVVLEPVALAQRDVKYTTAIRGGRGPDVFALDAPPSKQYIENGWVRDLSDFVGKQPSGWLESFYPRTLDVVRKDGKYYGVPVNVIAILFAYNERLFREAGVAQPPKTWSEFRAAAKKLTRSSSGAAIDRWATTVPIGPGCFDLRWTAFMRSFGANVLSDDWSRSALNSREALEALKFFVAMVKEDKTIPPGVAQVDCNGARQLVATNTVAMVLESIWLNAILKEIDPNYPDADIKYMPLPVRDGAVPSVRTTLYQKSLYINPHSKHPEAAWKLISFLTEKKQMERWFKDNQNLSAIRAINEESKIIASDPGAKILSAEIAHADFVPLVPQWPEISETVRKAVQDSVAGTATPEQALAKAHERVEAILGRSKR